MILQMSNTIRVWSYQKCIRNSPIAFLVLVTLELSEFDPELTDEREMLLGLLKKDLREKKIKRKSKMWKHELDRFLD